MALNWDTLQRKAKFLESRLESRVQKYSSLAQRINADLCCDEESPLIESKEEQELAAEIEHDLKELTDCINNMRSCIGQASSTPIHQQEGLIKRYSEIQYDFNIEFKKTSDSVLRKRESMELFQNSRSLQNEGNSSTSKLLDERNSIMASIKSVNGVFREAMEVRSSLANQRSILTGASSGLSGLISNVPTFNKLIDGIQKKSSRESLVIAVFIAVLVFFCIWWVFLR